MTEELEDLYGKTAERAEHRLGDVVSWPDSSMPNGLNTGEIIHISEGEPQTYVVSPNTEVFPVEIPASEIIESNTRP